MLYLLLIFLPLALAAGCILDRPWLGVVAAVGLAAVDLAIVLGLSPAAPVLWLGSTLQLGVTNGLVLAGWLLIMSGVALASLLDTAELRLAPVLMLLSSALSAALLVVQPPPAILLLLIASVVGSMLLSHGSFGLSRRYIALALIGAVFLVGVAGLAGTDDRLVIARAGLAVTGLGIWAMLLPMLVIFSPGVERFSLPTLIVLAGALPAISGIVVGSGVAPNGRAALGLAVLALVPAGMLLLMPQTPRQLVALLLVVDGVLLLPGQVLGSSDGLRAALIGSIAHAIAAVALLAGAVAHIWQARYSTRRQVLSSVVLLAGLLLLIGMPPSPGWYARVALWDAARAAGRPSMVLFAIGQLLLMAGAGRLAIGLLRARALPYTNGVAETPTRQRGVLLLRAVLLVALSAVLVSCFAVQPLLARIDTALAERGPVSGLQERAMRPTRVYLLDTGGCGACAAEVWSTVEPAAELTWAPGPGQADIVVLTGSLPSIYHEQLVALYEGFWRGRIPVVAVGRCAIDGYPFGAGGVRALKQLEIAGRIDVCPPLPELILELVQTVLAAHVAVK